LREKSAERIFLELRGGMFSRKNKMLVVRTRVQVLVLQEIEGLQLFMVPLVLILKHLSELGDSFIRTTKIFSFI